MLDLVGFHNFELLEKLFERRDIIREQCKAINERMQEEKQQMDNYRPKNMNSAPTTIGVVVEKGGPKKGKKKQANAAMMENFKVSNYELLRRLGFDRDFIDENKRQGL